MFEDELPADQGTAEMKEGLVEGVVRLVANEEPSIAVQPGEVTLGHPAVPVAGTLDASTLARLQSILPAAPKRLSNSWWSRCQTPAFCQSRSRRQQVIPLPQPISWGRSSQGMPVFSTKRIPVSAARSDTVNGCPPFGWAGFGGSNGSTTVHSSSLTSGLAMPLARHDPHQLC